MDSAYPEAGVESDRIRDLLASDRRLIGQARALRNQAPLRTASFHQPLRVRMRRRWRHDRDLRVRLIWLGLAFVLMAASGLWLYGRLQAAQLPWLDVLARGHAGPSLEREPGSELVPEIGSEELPRAPAPPTVLQPEESRETGSAIPAARRLQRADVWLRVETPQAARAARQLIEGALAELPGSVHGHVSLAEACLRLGDEACARRAVHTAMLARPWRSKYRALAERIDQAFTRDGAIVASGGPASVDTTAPGFARARTRALRLGAGRQRL